MRGLAGDVGAVEHHAAAARRIEAGEQIEQRGLAGAVRADDGEDLGGLDLERYAVDGFDAAEFDREVVGVECAHGSLRAIRVARLGTSPARRKIMNTIMIRPSAMVS